MMNANRIPIRILGLDPGLRRTGWGVVSVEGSRMSHVAHGVIAPDDKAEFFEPAADKIYRHPTFYVIPDEVGHM